jgi:hypothetical protein
MKFRSTQKVGAAALAGGHTAPFWLFNARGQSQTGVPDSFLTRFQWIY